MAGKLKSHLWLGTSGWSYRWENFYPPELKSTEKLKYFSKHFNAVEVNYSFYHLPKPETFSKWRESTPQNFIFAVKMSRFITHIKRLKNTREELKKFLNSVLFLKEKLGPVLVQLPPSFKINDTLLENFLQDLQTVKKTLGARELAFAFEFRHPSWFEKTKEREKILSILKKYKAAFVFAHSKRYPYPEDEPQTCEFLYFRFHGPDALFASKYGPQNLKPFAERIKKYLLQGFSVYAFFNNDFQGYAVEDARNLLSLINAPK